MLYIIVVIVCCLIIIYVFFCCYRWKFLLLLVELVMLKEDFIVILICSVCLGRFLSIEFLVVSVIILVVYIFVYEKLWREIGWYILEVIIIFFGDMMNYYYL